MKSRGSFNVTDFIEEYKNSIWKGERFFTSRTTKNYINTYISYHELDIRYVENKRRWIFNK